MRDFQRGKLIFFSLEITVLNPVHVYVRVRVRTPCPRLCSRSCLCFCSCSCLHSCSCCINMKMDICVRVHVHVYVHVERTCKWTWTRAWATWTGTCTWTRTRAQTQTFQDSDMFVDKKLIRISDITSDSAVFSPISKVPISGSVRYCSSRTCKWVATYADWWTHGMYCYVLTTGPLLWPHKVGGSLDSVVRALPIQDIWSHPREEKPGVSFCSLLHLTLPCAASCTRQYFSIGPILGYVARHYCTLVILVTALDKGQLANANISVEKTVSVPGPWTCDPSGWATMTAVLLKGQPPHWVTSHEKDGLLELDGSDGGAPLRRQSALCLTLQG